MNVLTALLASHSVEMNSLYPALVSTLEKKHEEVQQDWNALDQENKELRSLGNASSEEVRKLRAQLAEAEAVAARSSDELARTDAKLSDQALVVRDLQNELSLERSEVSCFVGSGIDCLARKFLSNDEFNATLARILTFSITSGVERGLWMGRTDAQFEEASRNDSRSIRRCFSEIVNIQPDKLTLSVVPASVPAFSFVVDKTFGWTFASKGAELPGLGPDVSSS
ncbi:hypothetical protein Tco_0267417 [Tanacetum coccineum]